MTDPAIPTDAYVRVPIHLLAQARFAKDAENLELLDDTVDSILESLAEPREHAEPDTNTLRAEHYRLTLNFPEQGRDWRTPVTVLSNRVPELADEIDRLRSLLARPALDSVDALDELPAGSIIRSTSPYGGVWEVRDEEDECRYVGAGAESFYESVTVLRYGPLELVHRPASDQVGISA